jgi:hypothetical protein
VTESPAPAEWSDLVKNTDPLWQQLEALRQANAAGGGRGVARAEAADAAIRLQGLYEEWLRARGRQESAAGWRDDADRVRCSLESLARYVSAVFGIALRLDPLVYLIGADGAAATEARCEQVSMERLGDRAEASARPPLEPQPPDPPLTRELTAARVDVQAGKLMDLGLALCRKGGIFDPLSRPQRIREGACLYASLAWLGAQALADELEVLLLRGAGLSDARIDEARASAAALVKGDPGHTLLRWLDGMPVRPPACPAPRDLEVAMTLCQEAAVHLVAAARQLEEAGEGGRLLDVVGLDSAWGGHNAG